MVRGISPYHECMRVVRSRLDRVVEVLGADDYRFARPEEVLPGPRRNVSRQLDRLAPLIGGVPMALAEFYRTVGSVDLCGNHAEMIPSSWKNPMDYHSPDTLILLYIGAASRGWRT